MDEPEVALSPLRQLSFLSMLHHMEKQGAQIIIATHSPLLMAYPGADMVFLEKDGFVRKNFRETDHFRILARFFSNPEDYMQTYLSGDV